jgi:hypothetical protein
MEEFYILKTLFEFKMKFGLNATNFGKTFGNPKLAVELIEEAEKAGWDGFFLWDHILYPESKASVVDPFITLTAAAVRTNRIFLGTAVTPLPRRKPTKLARECVTLDHISNGRLILGVGLGVPEELRLIGEETSSKLLARMIAEQIKILNGLWSGEEFSFNGEFYNIEEVTFLPKPVQQPRIKLWGAGTWPNLGPFKRAVYLDGIIPVKAGFDRPLTLEEWEQIIEYLKSEKELSENYDMARVYFFTGEDKQTELDNLKRFEEIGINWWIDSVSDWTGDTETIREVIREGPPKT